MVLSATVVPVLVNPTNPALAEFILRSSQAAAQTLGLNLHVLNASTESDFDGVFANTAGRRAEAIGCTPALPRAMPVIGAAWDGVPWRSNTAGRRAEAIGCTPALPRIIRRRLREVKLTGLPLRTWV
jgi:hypothetical protein